METRESFSIREYVSRMRSANVVKCWPFDESTSEESVKSLLPPITIKKFIWWQDELECFHSESSKNVDNSKKRNKKVERKGESSFRSGNDVEESDVEVGVGMRVVKVKSFSREKAKAPKKRSILDIFAAATLVERADSDEEEEDEDEKKKKKKKKKKTKNKEIIASKLKKAKKVIKKIKKKKKKKGDLKMDVSLRNKGDYLMFKLQDQDKGIKNRNSSYTTDNHENDIHDHVSKHKKKPRLQHLDADKNMSVKACSLIAQNRHQRNPKRGALQNHAKASPLQQSKKHILQEATQVNHFGRKKAEKHSKFLQKNNIRRKPSFPEEYVKLQKYRGSDMHNVHHASNMGKDSANVEANGTGDVSRRMANEVDARPATLEQLTSPCCMVDTSAFMELHNKEEPFSQFVTSSRTVDGKNKHLLNMCLREVKYACAPGSSCMSPEVCYNSLNTKMTANSSSTIGRRLNENFRTPDFRFPPACFRDYSETCNEPSVSCLSNLRKGANKMPQVSPAMDDARTVQYETLPHLSPRELLQTVCSQPKFHQTGNIREIRSINGINEDFIGLPLNSQGEFMMLSSSAKGHFNQTIKSNMAAAPSISLPLYDNALPKCFGEHSERTSWDCRTSSREQLNLFPFEDYSEESPAVFVPSRLDTTESRENRQTYPDLDLIKISNHSLRSENSLCNKDIWVQKSHANEKILSTMRLMGKEFVVGGKGFRGNGDEHIWKDKQIIDEFHFSSTSVSNVMTHDHGEPFIGKLRETLFVPSEKKSHISRSTFSHFDWETSPMHQSCFIARKINAAEEVYPGLSPSTSSGVCNGKPLFPEPFSSGCDSQVFNLELPIPTAANQDSYPSVSSSIHLKNKQNLPHAPTSAIRFPFMHPDPEGTAQSCWSQSPDGRQPPWSFDVPEKGMIMNNFQSYHDVGCSHHHVLPRNNWRPNSSVSTKPEAFPWYNLFSFGSTLQTAVDPASMPPTPLPQQPPVLCHPGTMPIPSVRKRHESPTKFREGMKSRIDIRGLDHGRISGRQTSAISNVAFRSARPPSLALDDSSQCDITKSTPCVNFEGVQNVETAVGSYAATKKSKIVICDEYRDGQNERIYPCIDSYSSPAMPCPMELTAKAKQILEACHQIDQSSSRFANSNLPLGAMTADFRFPESGNSAEIYKC